MGVLNEYQVRDYVIGFENVILECLLELDVFIFLVFQSVFEMGYLFYVI